MNKRRFFLFVFIFLACLALSFEAGASPGRMASMLLGPNTYWMIGLDETLFLVNPALLADLQPQVWIEIVAPVTGGVILSPMKNLNITVITGLPLSFGGFLFVPAVPAINVTNEQIRLGASLSLGQLLFGLTAMYTGTSETSTAVGAEHKNSNTVIDVGLGSKIVINAGSLDLDVAGDFKLWNVHREANGNVVTYDTTTFDVTALGRLNWEAVSNNTFHILGLFNLLDRSYTPGAGARVKNVTTTINAGFSDEIKFTESIMAFAGALFSMGIFSTDTEDTTTLDISGNAGIEAWLIKEMAVRVGVQHGFWHNVSTRVGATSVTSEVLPGTSVECGLAAKIGDLLVDIHLNNNLITAGPNFISGMANNMSLDFTVTYHFGPAAGQTK
jgi:hypothetical protein